jgi:hypothetical protein
MTGRPRRNTRPRDGLGRPLPYGAAGIDPQPDHPGRTPDQAIAEAQRLLDQGLPFHAHEVLEDAWKSAPEGERALWRGLAQLAVGATHAARGNPRGALALLRRGATAIAPYAANTPHGLDISAIVRWAEASAAGLDTTPAVLPPPPLLPPES